MNDNKKDAVIHIRLSAQDRAEVEKAAASHGMGFSEYARWALINNGGDLKALIRQAIEENLGGKK